MNHPATSRRDFPVSGTLPLVLPLAIAAGGCSKGESTEPELAEHVRVLSEAPRDYTGMSSADVVAVLRRKLDALEGIATHLAGRDLAADDLPALETALAEARKDVSELALDSSSEVDSWAARREALVLEVEELERRLFELARPLLHEAG